jgi:hypothetical protein
VRVDGAGDPETLVAPSEGEYETAGWSRDGRDFERLAGR